MQEIDERNHECTPQSLTSSPPLGSPSSGATPTRHGGYAAITVAGDTSGMAGRLTSSRFVGRQSQLAELEVAFREALDQRPRLTLVSGDSGVGKTRLLLEAERSFDGALLLHGQCLEQGELELPYAPLLGALRPLVREGDAALDALSTASRANLATLLPSLGAPPTDATGTGADGQVRLFESLLELLHLLSLRQPLVLVLEDMHWADGSTRAFVTFLARSLIDERILLLLSFRSDELHRRHPMRPLLAELSRLDSCRRLELEPFDHAELAEALTDILGEAPAPDLIDRLLMRTDGNPLYVEELMAAALDGRGATPQSLRDAFMLRIERLSDPAGRAVRAVAVGRALDERADRTRLRRQRGRAARRAARDRGRAHPGRRLTALASASGMRCCARSYTTTSYPESAAPCTSTSHARSKQAANLDCAEDEAERVAKIATHYAAAGDQPAALRATIRAAREARRVHAYREMAHLYERAHELWARVPDAATVAGIDEVGLLEAAANASALDGDQRHSEMLADHGLELLDPEQDPVRYARLLVRRGRSRWRLNQAGPAMADLDRALTLLPDEPSDERARLLSWIARTHVLRGHYREAVVEGERARAVAEAAQLPVVVGEVLNTLGMARIALGDVDAGEALLRQAITLAREQDDIDDLGTAYSNLADFLNLAGRTRDALRGDQRGPGRGAHAHGPGVSRGW